jgi:hypothetical protein
MAQTLDIFRQNHFPLHPSSTPPSTTALLTPPSPTTLLNPLDATLRRLVSLGNDIGWEVWFLTNGLWLIISILFFLAILSLKLFIGIYLLKFARSRTGGMKVREEKERQWEETRRKVLNVGKGSAGGVEVEDKVRGLLDRGEDDLLGLGRAREGKGLLRVERYSMVSKRIW